MQLDSLMEKDNERRALIQKAEDLKAARNQFSMRIARAKNEGGDLEQEKAEMRRISDEIKGLDGQIREVEIAIEAIVMEIPNIPHESVPVGSDSSYNQVVRTWGDKPQYDFIPKAHWDVGENWAFWTSTGPPRSPARASPSTGAWAPGSSARSSISCSTCTPASTATPKCCRRSW